MNPTTTPSRPRRRIRLTLRLTMALVLILGAVLGWVVNRARVQREAVARIFKAGGSVTYDGQAGRPLHLQARQHGWKWLREALGQHYFDTVVEIDFFKSSEVDDDLMATVGMLTAAEKVSFGQSHIEAITPAGFAHLRSLGRLKNLSASGPDSARILAGLGDQHRLESLSLGEGRATDADMSRIGSLRSLRSLEVDGRDLSQAGFEELSGLTNLITLRIVSDSVTDLSWVSELSELTILAIESEGGKAEARSVTGLASVWGLKKLTSLSLNGCRIDDAGLEGVEALTRLEELFIGGAELTDAGVERIAKLGQVSQIELGGRGITDMGLDRLSTMPRLVYLSLERTSVRHLQSLGSNSGRLDILRISDSPIVAEDLALLAPVRPLSVLELRSLPITDSDLAYLSGLMQIETLDLADLPITGAGLAYLQGMDSLTVINLKGPGITDANLTDLATIQTRPNPQYVILNVTETAISSEGLAQLREMAPHISLEPEPTPQE